MAKILIPIKPEEKSSYAQLQCIRMMEPYHYNYNCTSFLNPKCKEPCYFDRSR